MRILLCHNNYRFQGGEDAVVSSEAELLRSKGHEVFVYSRSNKEIDSLNIFQKIRLLFNLYYSKKTYCEMKSLIDEFKPDVAHFHNIFFMITPSAYFACKDSGVPIVQSLHNFRLLSALKNHFLAV